MTQTQTQPINLTCECADPLCPECAGSCNHRASEILYRTDMDDESGTAFCDQCSSDAMHSGLFVDGDTIAEREGDAYAEEHEGYPNGGRYF